MSDHPPAPGLPRGRFASTRWSVVLAAADTRPSAAGAAALAELCTLYWYPVYAYVRRRGIDAEEARDVTQEFFAKLLEKQDLAAADPARGRFRTFLLTAMKNFLVSRWRREAAVRRGGGVDTVPLDFPSAEARYTDEPAEQLTPEVLYARRWALELLDRALDDLRQAYVRTGQTGLFDALREYVGDDASVPYAELAGQLGMREGTLRTAVSRLRRRWRDQLRTLVAETVHTPAEVDDELRGLLTALTSTR